MKESRLYVVIAIMVLMMLLTPRFKVNAQSFYANRYDKGRTTQLNKKTVAQKKITVYHKRSLLYKMRRESAYNKKRKNFAKTSA